MQCLPQSPNGFRNTYSGIHIPWWNEILGWLEFITCGCILDSIWKTLWVEMIPMFRLLYSVAFIKVYDQGYGIVVETSGSSLFRDSLSCWSQDTFMSTCFLISCSGYVHEHMFTIPYISWIQDKFILNFLFRVHSWVHVSYSLSWIQDKFMSTCYLFVFIFSMSCIEHKKYGSVHCICHIVLGFLWDLFRFVKGSTYSCIVFSIIVFLLFTTKFAIAWSNWGIILFNISL